MLLPLFFFFLLLKIFLFRPGEVKEEEGELREEEKFPSSTPRGEGMFVLSSFVSSENCKKPAAPLSSLNSSFLSILFCSFSSLSGEIKGSKGDSPLWEGGGEKISKKKRKRRKGDE